MTPNKCPNCPESDLSRLDAVFEKFKGDSHALISILQQAQSIYGYLPTDVLYAIAEHTGNSPAKVMGVATFYTQFRLTPVGRHLILLCKGTACHVNGADSIERALNELGLADGETTPDGMFSLKTVACLGCCSLSPVMMIDENTYGSLTPDKAKSIIEGIKSAEASK
ncbi:MAG: NADH-quinone oxidoreductase subunit NuoE [Kiritimatiellae bacterium]|nr:NADH-quinone oxidoreductase subunit NuoE [Kiritimatiellia bacterium]